MLQETHYETQLFFFLLNIPIVHAEQLHLKKKKKKKEEDAFGCACGFLPH